VPKNLDYTREADVDELFAVHFTLENYTTDEIEFFVAKNPDKFQRIFETLFSVFTKKEIGYQYKCTSLLYELFYECYKQNYTQKETDSKITNAVEFLIKNYKKDVPIQEIAQKSFMGEVYFRKLFKAEFGVSPQKYIIQLRIQHAIDLMQTGYYTLKEIAIQSGYRDYKYFLTEFKRLKGVSPAVYLRSLQ
jgi:AraC-like DNA-binding protein